MSSYEILAEYYDKFTMDVNYIDWVNFYKKILNKYDIKPNVVLDLGCGTGTLTYLMSENYIDIIGIDSSVDMLSVAVQKESDNKPLFINQSMWNFKIHTNVDFCYSSLDSINYITNNEDLIRVFKTVFKYLNTGGLFIFDINSEEKFEKMSGKAFVRDADDVFLVWETDLDERICTHHFNFFIKNNNSWDRFEEIHTEKAYSIDYIYDILSEIGFSDIIIYENITDEGRVFISARKD